MATNFLAKWKILWLLQKKQQVQPENINSELWQCSKTFLAAPFLHLLMNENQPYPTV